MDFRSMTYAILVLCGLITIQPYDTVQGAEIHALIMVDSLCNIGRSTSKDIEIVHKELSRISYFTGMKLNLTELEGYDASYEAFHDWATSVSVNSDDVVFFYFSGHGFRTSELSTIWPILLLSGKNQGIDLYRVLKILQSHKSRLCIILGDCCNKFVGLSLERQSRRPKYKNGLQTLASSYRKLFVDTQGTIIASSSEIGQVSWGTELGGIFTQALIASLAIETQKEDPKWEQVFRNVYKWCALYQKPQVRSRLDGPPATTPLPDEQHHLTTSTN